MARAIQLSACGAVANPCDTRGLLPAPQTTTTQMEARPAKPCASAARVCLSAEDRGSGAGGGVALPGLPRLKGFVSKQLCFAGPAGRTPEHQRIWQRRGPAGRAHRDAAVVQRVGWLAILALRRACSRCKAAELELRLVATVPRASAIASRWCCLPVRCSAFRCSKVQGGVPSELHK